MAELESRLGLHLRDNGRAMRRAVLAKPGLARTPRMQLGTRAAPNPLPFSCGKRLWAQANGSDHKYCGTSQNLSFCFQTLEAGQHSRCCSGFPEPGFGPTLDPNRASAITLGLWH